MSRPYQAQNEMYLWWLGAAQPQRIGTLVLVGGNRKVALAYDALWRQNGFALSEDLPLARGLYTPKENDSAAGALEDARQVGRLAVDHHHGGLWRGVAQQLQQRLGRADLRRLQVDDRLVDHVHLAAQVGAAQARFDLHRPRQARAHRVVEHHQGGAAGAAAGGSIGLVAGGAAAGAAGPGSGAVAPAPSSSAGRRRLTAPLCPGPVL